MTEQAPLPAASSPPAPSAIKPTPATQKKNGGATGPVPVSVSSRQAVVSDAGAAAPTAPAAHAAAPPAAPPGAVDDIGDTPEENAAALKIQAMQRGKAARARVDELKAEKVAAEAAAKTTTAMIQEAEVEAGEVQVHS